MVIHHYKPECHMWKLGFYLQGQGHWIWVHTTKSWLFPLYVLNCWFFGNQLSLTVHDCKLECLVKRLLWSISCMSLPQRRNFTAKSLKSKILFSFFLKVRSDRYSCINLEILSNKNARVKLATEPTTVHAFLVSSVKCETLTYDATQCTSNQVPVTLSVYVLYIWT